MPSRGDKVLFVWVLQGEAATEGSRNNSKLIGSVQNLESLIHLYKYEYLLLGRINEW